MRLLHQSPSYLIQIWPSVSAIRKLCPANLRPRCWCRSSARHRLFHISVGASCQGVDCQFAWILQFSADGAFPSEPHFSLFDFRLVGLVCQVGVEGWRTFELGSLLIFLRPASFPFLKGAALALAILAFFGAILSREFPSGLRQQAILNRISSSPWHAGAFTRFEPKFYGHSPINPEILDTPSHTNLTSSYLQVCFLLSWGTAKGRDDRPRPANGR